MSLINCPECGGKVSNKSIQCIHCGYPIINEGKNICIVNGKECDLSNVYNQKNNKLFAMAELMTITNCTIFEAEKVVDQIIETNEIPKVLNLKERDNNIVSSNQRKCKYCGHTQFTPVRKKWSLLTGFMTNKTELICNNCGRRVE